jgi:hypothetical protein
VNIHVGGDRKKWALHERLLSSHSEYFRKAIEANRSKAGNNAVAASDQSNRIDLPNDDPKLFAMAVRWLYGITFAGKFEFPVPIAAGGESRSGDISVHDYMALYVMATKLEIQGLKNAAVDAIYHFYHGDGAVEEGGKRRCPDLRDVKYVFENTVADAPIRRLLVVSTLFYLFSRKNERQSNLLPDEWEEVIRSSGDIGWEIIKMVYSWNWVLGSNCPAMAVKKPCSFHEHGEGELCEEEAA